MKREKRFLGAPYMFTMVIGTTLSVLVLFAFVLTPMIKNGTILERENIIGITAILIAPYFLLLITFFCIRYEWATIVEIQEDRLLFKALFTRRSFYYKDMHYIGVDYGVLQGSKQFWIYFSEKEIPMKYYHQINRLKFTKDCMRVQYYKKAYNKLVEHTPPEISKQLRKCYSTVLLYKLDDED